MTSKKSIVILFALCYLMLDVSSSQVDSPFYNADKLQLVASWKTIEYAYPNEYLRQQAITAGEFIPGAVAPIDTDVLKVKDGMKIFVTTPRFEDGRPATLGYFTSKTGNSPLLTPFPNWEMNKLGNCNGLTSVYRIKIDECGRLWVLDTGRVNTQRICPPQLLVFDPRTDELISRYRIPESQLTNSSLLITPIVDVRDPQGQCRDTFVYMMDVLAFRILVYDHANRRSWFIQNNLFYPYPPFGTFTIDGVSFDLMDGIFTGALSPIKNGDRRLYFHSLASNVESYVSTSVIRNYNTFKDDPNAAAREFKSYEKKRTAQASAQAMDKNGVLFYGLVPETAIGCWNSRDYPEYGGNNLELLVANRQALQFASGLKIIPSPHGKDELWVMTMALQRLWTGTMRQDEVNFRIHAAYVDELVRGTKCDVSSHRINPYPSSASKNWLQNPGFAVLQSQNWTNKS